MKIPQSPSFSVTSTAKLMIGSVTDAKIRVVGENIGGEYDIDSPF
jgi:hypothetical protein